MDGAVWCMVLDIHMVLQYFWSSQIFLTTLLIHISPNDFYPESSKKDCCIAVVCFFINPKYNLSHPSRSLEYIAAYIFQLKLWIGWSSSRLLWCSNMSDMTSDKSGVECCLCIHYLRPSKPVDQHNSASWHGKWITCSTVSLYVRHLGSFKWFRYLQYFIHLATPHIPHDHCDSHCCYHIGIFFAAFLNTEMSVSTLEMCLFCD